MSGPAPRAGPSCQKVLAVAVDGVLGQGHVKITTCAEPVALSDELWNTAALVFPAQSALSLKM